MTINIKGPELREIKPRSGRDTDTDSLYGDMTLQTYIFIINCLVRFRQIK